MKEVEPTIFYETPSYSLYIAERARAKGVDPAKDFNFRLFFSQTNREWAFPQRKRAKNDQKFA